MKRDRSSILENQFQAVFYTNLLFKKPLLWPFEDSVLAGIFLCAATSKTKNFPRPDGLPRGKQNFVNFRMSFIALRSFRLRKEQAPGCSDGQTLRHQKRMKGLDRRGLKKEEENMRLITTLELANRNESELSALFRAVSNQLVMTKRHSPERRNSLATLENISRARAYQLSGPC